jgi:hypothetical protein
MARTRKRGQPKENKVKMYCKMAAHSKHNNNKGERDLNPA